MNLLVRHVEAVAPRIRAIELVDPSGAPLPPFSAGAHVDVHLPNGLTRSYSLLNDSRERDRYGSVVVRSAGLTTALHQASRIDAAHLSRSCGRLT